MKLYLICSLIFLLRVSNTYAITHNAVVDPSGGGNYKTVTEAINAAPSTASASSPWVIFIKSGTYKEHITIASSKKFITLLGESEAKTIITFNRYASQVENGAEIGTFATASVNIAASDFTVSTLTIENSHGTGSQALAVKLDGERIIFKNVRFLGWQDTILANAGHQYFENCYIEGHVDFIFGAATAFFYKCQIHCKSNGYITAASTPPSTKYGFVFSHCTVDGASGVQTYLGRPWKDGAYVAYINTEMSSVVRAEGWAEWDGRSATSRYYESGNTGAGSSLSGRVKWEHQLSASDASAMTAKTVLGGWDPTGTAAYKELP